MAVDLWDGLNVGLEFDEDENEKNFQFTMDHDEFKGEANIEFIDLLQKTVDDNFNDAEDPGDVEDAFIPEVDGMIAYFEDCITVLKEKKKEAEDFVNENSD